MIVKKLFIGLLFLFWMLQVNLFAQEFTIKKFEMAGEKLNVYYDLLDSVSGHTYTVRVYSSKDSYTDPVTKITGDVGQEVKPGINKKITWSAKDELGPEFEGKISLQVRGKLYVPFIHFDRFKDHEVRKRGVKFDILWKGGRPSSLLNFELERDGKFVQAPFTNIPNLGNYTDKIPTTVKPGGGYRFKITDSKNKDEYIYTNEFTVKRKIPLALMVSPVVAVGGVVGILYLLREKDIKDPPLPPERN
jgi:hypothetical protein